MCIRRYWAQGIAQDFVRIVRGERLRFPAHESCSFGQGVLFFAHCLAGTWRSARLARSQVVAIGSKHEARVPKSNCVSTLPRRPRATASVLVEVHPLLVHSWGLFINYTTAKLSRARWRLIQSIRNFWCG